jgi:hypothetical protein
MQIYVHFYIFMYSDNDVAVSTTRTFKKNNRDSNTNDDKNNDNNGPISHIEGVIGNRPSNVNRAGNMTTHTIESLGIYMYICKNICPCVYYTVCIIICMHICIYIYIYIYEYIYLYTYIYMYTRMYIYMCKYILI